uniref:Fe2OG dioxygenase domain-containing protein n=1 Tax=viral metagenome TaxID=1070528 RepID=A0A6C0AEQ1_9ZZZZ
MSLIYLDKKTIINIFDEKLLKETDKFNVILDDKIFHVRDFLSEEECDLVLENIKNVELEKVSFGSHDRSIIIDNNLKFTSTLEERINNSKINIDMKAKPYGFNQTKIKWDHNKFKVNQCYRMNIYTNDKFDWHRDSQYTETDLNKSNYSLILYLNDDYDGGELVIYPEYSDVYDGRTMSEEISILDDKLNEDNCIIIKPKKGDLILIDQRLLHKTLLCYGKKIILRSEIVIQGEYINEDNQLDSIENIISEFTRNLFIKAEQNDLLNIPSKELYEICINLRQNPYMLKSLPKLNDKFYTQNYYNLDITNGLIYISDGFNFDLNINEDEKWKNKHIDIFKYKGDTLKMVRIACLFTFLSYSKDKEKFIERFRKIIDENNINFSHMSEGINIKKIDNVINYIEKESHVIFSDAKYMKNIYDFLIKDETDGIESVVCDTENEEDKSETDSDTENEKDKSETESDIDPISLLKRFNFDKIENIDPRLCSSCIEKITCLCFITTGKCSNDCENKEYWSDNDLPSCRERKTFKKFNLGYKFNGDFNSINTKFINLNKCKKYKLQGDMVITNFGRSFNYAGCNHYDSIVEIISKDIEIFKMLNRVSFKVEGDKIFTYFNPIVVM